jgi:hypothetical protein
MSIFVNWLEMSRDKAFAMIHINLSEPLPSRNSVFRVDLFRYKALAYMPTVPANLKQTPTQRLQH